MESDHEPPIDADYRVVRGPWPRWMLQFSLLRLALRTAGVVIALILIAVALLFAVSVL